MRPLIERLLETQGAESTSELVGKAQLGGEERFRDLYLRTVPALVAWAGLRIPDALRAHLDPEDLVQEVWSRALGGFQSYDAEQAPFRAWLFGIARHVLLQSLRTLRVRFQSGGRGEDLALDDVPAEITSLSQMLARDDELKKVIAFAKALDAEDQALFLRHGLEGAPLRSVAEELGANHEAMKKRWQRLCMRLSKAVEGTA